MSDLSEFFAEIETLFSRLASITSPQNADEAVRAVRAMQEIYALYRPQGDIDISGFAEELDALREKVNSLRISPGHGIEIRESASGVSISAVPGTEGRSVIPFGQLMDFDAICKIDELAANSGTNYDDIGTITNTQAANEEERLLLHAAQPFCADGRFFERLALVVNDVLGFEISARTGVRIHPGTIEARVATADFDTSAVTWDSWDTAGPPVGTRVINEPYLGNIDDLVTTLNQAGILEAGIATVSPTYGETDVPNGSLCYGIEIRKVCQTSGGAQPTFTAYSAVTTVDEDLSFIRLH